LYGNISGDWHYGVKGVSKQDIIEGLDSSVPDKERQDTFRFLTGDLIENSLKTSIGHNYDVEIPDPAVQKKDVIDILKRTTKKLYGPCWNKVCVDPSKVLTQARCLAVSGNHEYRSRKLSGQWLTEEMCKEANIVYGGMESIVELTIYNKRLQMERTFRIFIAHRPSSKDSTSIESILRAFKRKQAVMPGVDVIIFGHMHRKFAQADGYFDSNENRFKKILYLVNPSPMACSEYASDAGYPPLSTGWSQKFCLPLSHLSQISSEI
jgi:predicted phosphodiesterase